MKWFVWSIAIATTVLAGASSFAASPAPAPQLRKLIEMGWDEPDPGFMRRHLAQLEATPFDGCVYHITYSSSPGHPPGSFTREAWGKRVFTAAELDSSVRDLVATPFVRFRWNFLRMNVTPADLDWFDEYAAVIANARLAASIARRGRSAGVMIDTEPYTNELFKYPAQRDAATRSFAEYTAQVRRRGAEVMRALEQGYPGLTVFLTVGPSVPYLQSLGGWKKETSRYGMLYAFVDGMVSVASDSSRIVDGSEPCYSVREPKELDPFCEAQTHGMLAWASDSTRFRDVLSRSFGLWLDHDSPHRGWNVTEPDKNYRPPAALQSVVRRALELADDYVWLYSEKPRWWTEQGGRKDLPDAYDQALRKARKGLTPP